jgi:hypothetical protein
MRPGPARGGGKEAATCRAHPDAFPRQELPAPPDCFGPTIAIIVYRRESNAGEQQ